MRTLFSQLPLPLLYLAWVSDMLLERRNSPPLHTRNERILPPTNNFVNQRFLIGESFSPLSCRIRHPRIYAYWSGGKCGRKENHERLDDVDFQGVWFCGLLHRLFIPMLQLLPLGFTHGSRYLVWSLREREETSNAEGHHKLWFLWMSSQTWKMVLRPRSSAKMMPAAKEGVYS